LKRQARERDDREKKREQDKACRPIQKVFRGFRVRKATRAAQRAVFDKRQSDIAKVQGLVPADARVAFLFRALVPMMRLLAFFFWPTEDAARLTSILEMVHASAQAPPQFNVFHLLGKDSHESAGPLALMERLMAACVRVGQAPEGARLLLTMRRVLGPAQVERTAMATSQLLRRTKFLEAITGQPPMSTELVRACCEGLAATQGPVARVRLGVLLLSTPRLCEGLLQESAGSVGHDCLRHITEYGLPPAGAGSPATAAASGLEAEVHGASRWAWFLGNAACIVELLAQDAQSTELLRSWLAWLCWARGNAEGPSPEVQAQQRSVQDGRLARALLARVGPGDPEALLLPVLAVFFRSGVEVSQELLQALAFTTTFAAQVFPTLKPLLKCQTLQAAMELLGPPQFSSDIALRLRAFCEVYRLQLQPMYDREFFGRTNPLSHDEVLQLAELVNNLAYRLVILCPDQSNLPADAKALRNSLSSLAKSLYNRHRRQELIGLSASAGASESTPPRRWWLIPESRGLLRGSPVVDLGTDEMEEDDDAMEDDGSSEEDGARADRPRAAPPASVPLQLGGAGAAVKMLEAVLDEVPHVLPFEDRVALLHNVILNDQAQRSDDRAPWGRTAMNEHSIRRTDLVEDGFAAFRGLDDETSLRSLFRVQFIGPDGNPETGIDGGGLFKEFMIRVCREIFSAQYGLFEETTDRTLYPSPGAFRTRGNAGELYRFVGKVVGKAIYEMVLLEPQFSRVFLNRILGRINEIDDVAALDRDLHRGLLRFKENADQVASLGLTFIVTAASEGGSEDVELKPGGRQEAVTADNLTEYLFLFANYRTNSQIRRHVNEFVHGIQCVMPMAWLKMFDPYELNTLISGSNSGFDLEDLKRNTHYAGGYEEDSPVVQWLWQLLEQEATVEDMGLFLMFATSCSRPPLLGFRTLFPKFCIHRVPDSVRLPTASTCANLLKLPDYLSYGDLKLKLMQAIHADSGFELS